MKAIDKGQLSNLLTKLYDCIRPQLAVAGFAKCHVYPFDPTVNAAGKLAPGATFK